MDTPNQDKSENEIKCPISFGKEVKESHTTNQGRMGIVYDDQSQKRLEENIIKKIYIIQWI